MNWLGLVLLVGLFILSAAAVHYFKRGRSRLNGDIGALIGIIAVILYALIMNYVVK